MSRNIFLIPCNVTYLVMSTCTAYHKEPLQSNSLFSDVHVGSELANRYQNDFDNSIYQQAMILSNRRPRSTKPTFKTGRHHHLLYLSFIIMLQSADCKLNPGPRTPKYPCLVCTKAVRCNHRGTACDTCAGWYHTHCIDMDSKIYNALARPDASWIYCQCGLPNFSTSFFEALDAGTFNTFESLSDLSLSSVSSDIGDPITASSPKSTKPPSCNRKPESTFMKVLTINFQSIKAKREAFWNLLESSKPDIILGCETWLKPTITNHEIIPPGYDGYRKDRP